MQKNATKINAWTIIINKSLDSFSLSLWIYKLRTFILVYEMQNIVDGITIYAANINRCRINWNELSISCWINFWWYIWKWKFPTIEAFILNCKKKLYSQQFFFLEFLFSFPVAFICQIATCCFIYKNFYFSCI